MRKSLPFILGAGALLSLLCVVTLLPTAAAPASAQEPTPTVPMPTWTPGPAPTKTPVLPVAPTRPAPAGAKIALHVHFPETWPWETAHWQDLWTVVEWQDHRGTWHAVDGWQGGLDGVTTDESGQVTGTRVWWVTKSDLGNGPFRWRVYQGTGSALLGQSEPFYLPDSAGDMATIDVVIGW